MAAQSKAWTVLARSNTGIVGSNSTRRMDVCVRLVCVCVVLCIGSGLATGWRPVQGYLPTVYRIKKLKKRPRCKKRTREWLRWRGPASTVNDRPIISSDRMLHKDYNRKSSVVKRNTGRESQGVGAKTNWLAVNSQSSNSEPMSPPSSRSGNMASKEPAWSK
jgi:hypothetical protein